MGLDMYLYRKTYVQNWDEKNKCQVSITKAGDPSTVNPDKIVYVIEEVLYWRKANAIHNWFVTNVQNGTDDCGDYPVDVKQLKELRDACQQAFDNSDKREELLPTKSGFFFGSTEYDQFYLGDLVHTVKELDKLLEQHNNFLNDYYYRSSW